MAERLLIDTDVLIEYLLGWEKAVEYLEGLVSDLSISVISVAELFLVTFDRRHFPMFSEVMAPYSR